ncbi:MAG: energy-coupling factor transporter transmembrane component T [Cypionkella sp.]|nr:energy-coupling factor transporter transmembrane component T [Cypionkella sp.]
MLTLTYPHKSWAHGLPAGAKLAALALTTAGLFAANSPAPLAAAAIAAALLTLSCGRGFTLAAARALWVLWPFVAIVAAWHIWLRDAAGAVIILRMITAVALANFVTMTTRLTDMIAVIEWLLHPISRLIPAPRLALAIALTIRFIPVMMLRANALAEGWRARSPRPPRWRILPALTLSALDDAARVAEALRARGGVQ